MTTTATSAAYDRIAELRTEASPASSAFIDTTRLSELFTKHQVADILQESGAQPYQILEYPSLILRKAPKLFAILICIQNPRYIVTFLEHSIFDDKLPLHEAMQLRDENAGRQLSPEFFRTQYQYIPHYFEKGLHSRIRDDQIVLPFKTLERLGELDGSFGSICRVSISPAFHNLPLDPNSSTFFIRKELRAQKDPLAAGSFEVEKKNLQLLHCIKHKNIVELLCSYSIKDGGKDRHFLLFVEEPIDLEAFFKKPKPPGYFTDDNTFYFAIQGLTSALHSIHNFNIVKEAYAVDFKQTGSHRDLRPNNILVRSDTMLIADFGLSDFKDHDHHNGSKTLWKAGRGDYIAPECYGDAFIHQIVGRSLDIWAFGCIIIDIITYMKQGHAGLKRFREARVGPWRPPVTNGYFFHDDDIKPVVLNHIINLATVQEDAGCFLLLIVARNMLNMVPADRPSSSEVQIAIQYACLVKVFDQMVSILVEYDRLLDSNQEVIPSRLTLCFEIERLRSWGEVLGISCPDCNLIASGWIESSANLRSTQGHICDIRDLLRQQHTRMKVSLDTPRDDQQAVALHMGFQTTLSTQVQKLFDLLPAGLQKRADIWWTQRLLDNSEAANYAAASRGSSNNPYRELVNRARVKKNLLAVSETSTHDHEIEDSQLCLVSSKLSGQRVADARSYAFYEHKQIQIPVLVEQVTLPNGESGRHRTTLEESRIRKLALARLLATPEKPSDFHVMDCLGFIEDDILTARFIYKLPESYTFPAVYSTGAKFPRDLLSVIEKDKQPPPLEQRIKLAQVLVSSVHSLHLSGWLHKSLRPTNVLLFSNSSGSFDVTAPRIVGFEQSRPDGDIWISPGAVSHGPTDIYVHPNYRLQPESDTKATTVRFRRVYDYYSLGLMLLEIALWRPLKRVLPKTGGSDAESNELLTVLVPSLIPRVGSAFAKAVRKCIETDFEEDQPGTGAEGQVRDFYIGVVEPIMEILI